MISVFIVVSKIFYCVMDLNIILYLLTALWFRSSPWTVAFVHLKLLAWRLQG